MQCIINLKANCFREWCSLPPNWQQSPCLEMSLGNSSERSCSTFSSPSPASSSQLPGLFWNLVHKEGDPPHTEGELRVILKLEREFFPVLWNHCKIPHQSFPIKRDWMTSRYTFPLSAFLLKPQPYSWDRAVHPHVFLHNNSPASVEAGLPMEAS